ncbi:hypothetical protein QN219_30295 [Sinorhizobium sp. 7-81]|uniref:hypothetical protein n=1 Tax=Sinorhizobium sp. 8-89 TaxID=3049089 RepID=UPI0024C4390F|nr:hypothetical protein [Sinorhizobium sp. 8-89]MDK1494257.1 hypothetical protein [Sinorhizobium sp. 8-89]
MTAMTSPSQSEMTLFGLLVCELTGFDDFDTQLLALNLSILRAEKAAVGDIDQLLKAYKMLREESGPGDIALRCQALRSNGEFAATLKQILYLFYLGSICVDGHWKRCGWRQHEDALVWRALGVHSPMTRGDGEFADWACKPRQRDRPDRRSERRYEH